MFSDRGIELLVKGDIPFIFLAELDLATALAFTNNNTRSVVFYRDDYLHSLDGHHDIVPSELNLLPDIIKNGTCIIEKNNKACIFYYNEENKRLYNTAIKAVKNENCIRCLTFHIAHPRNLRSKLTKGRKIRDQI